MGEPEGELGSGVGVWAIVRDGIAVVVSAINTTAERFMFKLLRVSKRDGREMKGSGCLKDDLALLLLCSHTDRSRVPGNAKATWFPALRIRNRKRAFLQANL